MSEPLTLTSLPLFPLGTALFPAGRLPLRVFEVRYLDMIGKCQRAGAPFGVVALAQGSEVRVAGAPPEQLQAVGTLAHIEQLGQPQPGLMTLVARGEQRFRIDRQHRLPHGLWVADVTLLPLDPTVAVPDDLQPAANALRQLHERVAAQPPEDVPAGVLVAGDAAYDDCGWVANRWAELLPLPLATRYLLLTLDNPLIRLELVADMLARAGISA